MNLLVSKKVKTKYIKETEDESKSFEKSSLLKLLFKVAFPAALETFFVGLMGVIDTMMVGKFSKEALSAVSICQQPVCITLCFAWGINVGITACIARRKGEGNKEAANSILRQGLTLSFFVSILFMILTSIWGRDILILAGAQEDTIDLAETYLKIVSYCLPFNYIRLIVCAAQRSIGKTTIVLIVNIIANSINVFLNFLLIKGHLGFPSLGVEGAAIATNIGNFIATVVIFGTVYKNKNNFISISFDESWKLSKKTIGLVLTVAMPAFVEQLSSRFGFFIIGMIVNNLGTHDTAVNAILSNIVSINFNIVDGFALGTAALIGESLGEKNHIKAFAYGRLAQICSFFIGLLSAAVAVIFRTPLSKCFSDDYEVYMEASQLLLFVWTILIPQAMQWTNTGILKGAGDTQYCARTAILSISIIRPLFSYILCWPLGLGVLGSWLGMLIDQSFRGIIGYIRFGNLKWLEKRA